DCQHPVICLMEEQKNVTDKGGTMRLGACPCVLVEDSIAHQCYEREQISERHRHRYEFNNQYLEEFRQHGMVATGTSPDGTLVEIIEVPDHPWYLAVQFHPEFQSKLTAPHPLFKGFVSASLRRHQAKR